jgi:hypothetical protein
MSFSSERTVTADFLSPEQLANRFGRSLQLIAGGGYPYFSGTDADTRNNAELFTNAMTTLIEALPSASIETSDVTSDSHERTLDIEVTDVTSIQTQGQLGPGQGDLIVYLANVRLIWAAVDDQVFLSLLGWDRPVIASARSLRDEIQTLSNLPLPGGGGTPEVPRRAPNVGALVASLRAMLALDPSTQGASFRDNSRFASSVDDSTLGTIELRGPAHYSREHIRSVTQRDKAEHVDTRVQTEDQSSGFLSIMLPFLGDPTMNTSIETRTSQSNSLEVSAEQGVHISLDLYAELGEAYAVEIYFDRVFGAFAFERVSVLGSPRISGRSLDPNGQPLVNDIVTLLTNNGRFVTITDQQGDFAFSASTIQPGHLMLVTNTARHEINFSSGQPIREVLLRGSRPRIVSTLRRAVTALIPRRRS